MMRSRIKSLEQELKETTEAKDEKIQLLELRLLDLAAEKEAVELIKPQKLEYLCDMYEYCEKDIIRMVVGGEDKFYRKCDYTCKKRSDKDYLNYDP